MANGDSSPQLKVTNTKAYGAGFGAMAAQPVGDAIAWALMNYVGMPIEIARPLGIVIAGTAVGVLTFFLPGLKITE